MSLSYLSHVHAIHLHSRLARHLSHHEEFHDLARREALAAEGRSQHETRAYCDQVEPLAGRQCLLVVPGSFFGQSLASGVGISEVWDVVWLGPVFFGPFVWPRGD